MLGFHHCFATKIERRPRVHFMPRVIGLNNKREEKIAVMMRELPAVSQATPEQMKAGIDAWMAWSRKAGAALVDLGNPLGNSAKLSGGKLTDSGSDAGGYSFLQAESRAALEALLADHPHLQMPGATIEVHEVLPIPGM